MFLKGIVNKVLNIILERGEPRYLQRDPLRTRVQKDAGIQEQMENNKWKGVKREPAAAKRGSKTMQKECRTV